MIVYKTTLKLIRLDDGSYKVEVSNERPLSYDHLQLIVSCLLAALISHCKEGPAVALSAVMRDVYRTHHIDSPVWPGW